MATQLTRRRISAALTEGVQVVHVPPRLLVLGTAAALVAVYASLLVGANASLDRQATADARYADARTLIEVPPVPLATLQAERDAARNEVARLEALLAAPGFDPASDEPTALIVERAQGAGLSVSGIARTGPQPADVAGAAYTVHVVRVTVSGHRAVLGRFLSELHAEQPALVATLASLAAEGDNVTAELLFSVYTPAPGDATPEAGT